MTQEEREKIILDLNAKCSDAVEAIHALTDAMRGFTETVRKCL